MDLARPFLLVTPTVDGDVLAALAGADAGFTGRGLHRVIGRRSSEGVRKSLERLATQGLVTVETIGASSVYRLNRAHLAAPHIEAIAGIRSELLRRLRDRFESWAIAPAYAALFGSAARADMQPTSDIDLFVVRPDDVDPDDAAWRDQIDSITRDVSAWTGNDVRPVEYGAEEAVRAAWARHGLVPEIAREGIHLAGPTTFLRKRA